MTSLLRGMPSLDCFEDSFEFFFFIVVINGFVSFKIFHIPRDHVISSRESIVTYEVEVTSPRHLQIDQRIRGINQINLLEKQSYSPRFHLEHA